MEQAPGYGDQERLRREYIPQQQPTVPAQGQPAPGTSTADRGVAPLSWSDWVRWGPIWSGFFTIVSTLAILGALGAGIALTVWGSSPNRAFVYGWAILTGIIAYFLGGWITARSAGVGGAGAAMLNAGLAWALSLVAILALVIFGVGNAFGFIGSNLSLLLRSPAAGVTPAQVSGTVAQTAWVTFASLVIGLILAMIGGVVGARRLSAWRAQHTV
jgi:hypothetical protein